MTKPKFAIRRQEPADAVALHAVYSQPNVIWGTTMLPHPSLHLWQKAVEEPRGMTRLVACAEDQVIGNIALTINASPRRRHAGSIAMAVHDDWQGKGCGYALLLAAIDLADNWFGLQRLELEVYTDNTAGVSLYKGCGFRIEGTLEHYAFRNGEYVDVYTMARIANGA